MRIEITCRPDDGEEGCDGIAAAAKLKNILGTNVPRKHGSGKGLYWFIIEGRVEAEHVKSLVDAIEANSN